MNLGVRLLKLVLALVILLPSCWCCSIGTCSASNAARTTSTTSTKSCCRGSKPVREQSFPTPNETRTCCQSSVKLLAPRGDSIPPLESPCWSALACLSIREDFSEPLRLFDAAFHRDESPGPSFQVRLCRWRC